MFKELLFEKSREVYLNYFKIDRKDFLRRRIFLAILLIALGGLMTILSKQLLVIFIAIFLGFVGFKLPYLQLLQRKSQSDMIKTFMFPQFLRYFIALYATQGNVYRTLIETAKYLDEPLRGELERFIDDIGDENSYARYVEFADYIGTTEAQLVMSMIYSFSEQGAVEEELLELEKTSKKINDNKMQETINYKSKKQEKYMRLTLVLTMAYIFSFVATVLITRIMSVFSMMGSTGV